MHLLERHRYSAIKPSGVSQLLWLLLAGFVLSCMVATPAMPQSTDMEKTSDKLFSEAKQHFLEQNYWETARDLIILLDFNLNYSRLDEVIFSLAECLYEIDLPQGAARLYQHLITHHLRSPLQPHALLGLQRIEYDRQDYTRCINYHETIQRSTPPAEVLDVSLYFAGLAHYHVRDFPKTIELLGQISVKSPYYPFAQYTLALGQMRMKQIPRAMITLRDVCDLTVDSEKVRALIDETHLTLGYLYYELGYYRQALNQFLMVSPTHESYDAALLASGWSLVQLGEFTNALSPLTDLVSHFPEKETTEEALFVLGRCYMKLERYEAAIRVYDHLISLFPSKEVMPTISQEIQAKLLDESITAEKIKTDLLIMESDLLDALPLQGESNQIKEYLREERRRILDVRQGLLHRLQEERNQINFLIEQMDELLRTTRRKQSRMDWRAYAEFGKSRALFLQALQQ